MYVFAYVAAVAIAVLGGALLVAPVRSTRTLHDWYIVPPALEPAQRLRVAVCRVVGAGLVFGAIALAVSITVAVTKLI